MSEGSVEWLPRAALELSLSGLELLDMIILDHDDLGDSRKFKDGVRQPCHRLLMR
jgi:hypothetical protein